MYVLHRRPAWISLGRFWERKPKMEDNNWNLLSVCQGPCVFATSHNTSMPESIIGLDIFHGWHIGAGKVFVSSTLVLSSEQFDESSVPKRFEKLHDCFFAWCRRQGVRPYIRKLSQETIKWMQTTEFPSGAWSKGSTTTCLLRFIIDFCKERETSIEETLLSIAYKAALEIDAFLSKIYKEGVWIHKEKALEISSHGMTFLRFNGRLAFQAFQQGRALYPFMPNLHRCHDIFWDGRPSKTGWTCLKLPDMVLSDGGGLHRETIKDQPTC